MCKFEFSFHSIFDACVCVHRRKLISECVTKFLGSSSKRATFRANQRMGTPGYIWVLLLFFVDRYNGAVDPEVVVQLGMLLGVAVHVATYPNVEK